ncbi:MAG TPA: hypothetical protein PK366_07305 [Fibrobacteraceae bacterium]|nr:hypothetical protein [Fibrobacteraceae bacterium]
MKERNRLRTSCASAMRRGDFKKLEPEEGAVQPITATARCAKGRAPRQ